MDIANHRIFKTVSTTSKNEEKRNFFKVEFANKGLDTVNISNIFHQKSVQKTIPDYLKKSYTCFFLYLHHVYCIQDFQSQEGFTGL